MRIGVDVLVSARRTEAADAQEIEQLISPSTEAVFGTVNVLHLLERANMAVTLAGEEDQVLAHAALLDHPSTALVDSACWEGYLQEYYPAETCTPLNSLFLHLFVSQPGLAVDSIKEIVRTVFTASPQLDNICLLLAVPCTPELALREVFEPMDATVTTADPAPGGLALVCRRHAHCPRLLVRLARTEDVDDLTRLISEQTEDLTSSFPTRSVVELMEAQRPGQHAVVCEVAGIAVGFMFLSGMVSPELTLLLEGNMTLDPLRHPLDDTEDTTGPTSPRRVEAFCIQMFVMDRIHVSRSVDFLPYIFQLFPDRDYCVMSIPQWAPEPPLLQSFLRVHWPPTTPTTPPMSPTTPQQQLYAFPRSGLLKGLEVRRAQAADRTSITALVDRLPGAQVLLQDLDQCCQCSPYQGGTMQTFVAQLAGQIVAVLVLMDERELPYLSSHYDVETFLLLELHGPQDHARLLHMVLQPPLMAQAPFLLREGLRLAHKTCLFARLHPPYRPLQGCCVPLQAVLRCTVPVRPRRQVVYPLDILCPNAPISLVTTQQPPFALRLLSRKLTLEPKVSVNTRVVLVGASDTSLAFLEVLALLPHLTFNNLTLISTHGYPGDHDYDEAGFLSTSHAYSSRDLALRSVQSAVTVLRGTMEAIDRRAKQVLVSGGRTVPYDLLLLCTGLQYQVPWPIKANASDSGHTPSNLFTLNGPHDCLAARHWLIDNFVPLEDSAVVYGSGLDVYTCVETLLSLGVRGPRIHLALIPDEGPPCWPDPDLERVVDEALEAAGVLVHHGCRLAQTNDGQEGDALTSLTLHTAEKTTMHLACGVLLNLSTRGVDVNTFRSVNHASLVFDGRLVIDSAYRTCDPSIYAAGPLVKYSHRYHADHISHALFSSMEVGRYLANGLLPLLDPTLAPPGPDPALLPQYTQPRTQAGKLPGGYNYLHITTATLPDSASAEQQGTDIVTGRLETGHYFRVHLNCYQTVESLTCLSMKPLPNSNYLCLHGRHQELLNHLVSRYDQDLVPDLYSFFSESWCLPLYHDRFPDLLQELEHLLKPTDQQDCSSLQGVLEEGGVAALRRTVVSYLRYNRQLLPMFALPDPCDPCDPVTT